MDTQRAQLGKLEAGYRVEEVEQAREQVRSAKAQADYAKIQLDRITSMHRQNAISQQALDNALSLARQSLANLAAAEQARDMHERGYRKEDIEAQKATLAAAEADLELARIALADCELHAPSSGVVLTRAQEEGAIVAQGSPLLTLTLSDPVWLRVYVDEPNLGHVKPGARILVWADCSVLGKSSQEIEDFLLADQKLWINAGAHYGKEGDSFIRINIACPRTVLKDGLQRLHKGLCNISETSL